MLGYNNKPEHDTAATPYYNPPYTRVAGQSQAIFYHASKAAFLLGFQWGRSSLHRGALCDWWAFGEKHYGERKAIVDSEDWEGPAYQTCFNASNVAQKFKLNRRRLNLSFTHHAEVAARPPAEADRLLDWAEDCSISVSLTALRSAEPSRALRTLAAVFSRSM